MLAGRSIWDNLCRMAMMSSAQIQSALLLSRHNAWTICDPEISLQQAVGY